jgi:hypothetical protein
MRDWDYQSYWHNGQYLMLLETNSRTGETLVSFPSGYTKWRFMNPDLRQMAVAVILYGEPLYGLFDYLMEFDGFANDWDKSKFRSEVAKAMERLQEVEVPADG